MEQCYQMRVILATRQTDMRGFEEQDKPGWVNKTVQIEILLLDPLEQKSSNVRTQVTIQTYMHAHEQHDKRNKTVGLLTALGTRQVGLK